MWAWWLAPRVLTEQSDVGAERCRRRKRQSPMGMFADAEGFTALDG